MLKPLHFLYHLNVHLNHLNGNDTNLFMVIKVKLLNLHMDPDKNAHFRRKSQMALRGFCICIIKYIF